MNTESILVFRMWHFISGARMDIVFVRFQIAFQMEFVYGYSGHESSAVKLIQNYPNKRTHYTINKVTKYCSLVIR